MNEAKMEAALSDPREIDFRVFETPLSGIREHDKKIRYFDFLFSLRYEGYNEALKRIAPRINMSTTNQIILIFWKSRGLFTR